MTIPTILSHYRELLPHINMWDACGLMNWLDEVSFWLARVDEQDYQRWMLVMSGALETKVGKPLQLCLGLLEGHVERHLKEKGVRR